MKRVLVIGASRGIGEACAREFAKDHEVITVARTGSVTIHGDIRKSEFCDWLVREYATVDVVVICSGILAPSYWDTMETNFLATGYLLVEFYHAMKSNSTILFIGSTAKYAANSQTHRDRFAYNVSRAASGILVDALSGLRANTVRVIGINPGWTNTSFALEGVPIIPEEEYENPTWDITPLKPEYVAEVIRWAASQPDHVHIGNIDIRNMFRNGLPHLHRHIHEFPMRSVSKLDRFGQSGKYQNGHASGREFVTETAYQIDMPELIAATLGALEKVPFDDRNQICLNSRVGSTTPLYEGIGRIYDAGPEVSESEYVVLNEEFRGTYFEAIYDEIKRDSAFGIGRVRLMRIPGRKCYSTHTDLDMRLHIAIQTNPGAYLLTPSRPPVHIPANGHLYVVDTRLPHTALNTALQDRIHLVFCTYEKG